MNGRIRIFAALCAFAALWICGAAQAAGVRAWLDRNTMQLGETVTLNVQADGSAQAQQPDFSALSGDFTLTGTQSSTSVNIVNGTTTASVLWAVGLSPKHAGTFTIPALDVAGQKTAPLTLTVSAPSANATQPGGDVFVEMQADPPSPYVQQQVRLTVKLYFAVNLIDGDLADPQASGAVVRKLGQDSRYRAQAGGRSYNVVERHYALTPESDGKLSVAPVVFRGHAMDANGGGFFFNQGRLIGAQSPAAELNVRPRPANSGKDTWLPAQSMSLVASGIDASTQAHVGEPLTLTLRLEAQGLGFEQLPELELPKLDGASIYPDKTTTQNKDDGRWIYGVRERKFAIVPDKPGKLTLPPISLAWWDTAHDHAETAELPAIALDVLPATGVAGSPPPASAAQPAPPAAAVVPPPSVTSIAAGDTAEVNVWRNLAFVALALWAATILAWIAWLLASRRGVKSAAPAQTLRELAPARAFADACTREDMPAIARSLLAWARQSRPALRNLGELAHGLQNDEQASAIAELERACYGDGSSPGLAARIGRAFGRGFALTADAPNKEPVSRLPELYPFRS